MEPNTLLLYMEQHSVGRMIGAPPGNLGCDEGGELTRRCGGSRMP